MSSLLPSAVLLSSWVDITPLCLGLDNSEAERVIIVSDKTNLITRYRMAKKKKKRFACYPL